jgi:hypothetical protein
MEYPASRSESISFIQNQMTACGTKQPSGFGRSYAYDYCYYYKTRALGAKNRERKKLMWAKYRACLKEYGG